MKRVAFAVMILSLTSVFAEAAQTISSKSSRNSTLAKKSSTSKTKGFTVTLTTYWAIGSGSDYWTRRFTSSTGQRLIPNETVAADPNILPYGSVIEIEGVGRRIVKDTGTHVIQKVASRKRGVDYPVIDLFFNSRQEALAFARNHAPFAQVTIVKGEA